jgi:hypothetical protein
MPDNVLVTCISKRDRQDPHERIEGLGGVYGGKRWYMREEDIILELEKPNATREWNFYANVDGHSAWVIVAEHNNRKYLKTQNDDYSPDNLLSMDSCPVGS